MVEEVNSPLQFLFSETKLVLQKSNSFTVSLVSDGTLHAFFILIYNNI